ncbi:MAG: hypothetical protein KJT03_10725 [Verrucomicrobiae bacterium]|nr:hypothetical protein [Verrucomicrobiae bacterium]
MHGNIDGPGTPQGHTTCMQCMGRGYLTVRRGNRPLNSGTDDREGFELSDGAKAFFRWIIRACFFVWSFFWTLVFSLGLGQYFFKVEVEQLPTWYFFLALFFPLAVVILLRNHLGKLMLLSLLAGVVGVVLVEY